MSGEELTEFWLAEGVCVPESRYLKKRQRERENNFIFGVDAVWVTVERFVSQISVLVSASFTRLPLKFISTLKCRVTLNNQKMVVLFNMLEIE